MMVEEKHLCDYLSSKLNFFSLGKKTAKLYIIYVYIVTHMNYVSIYCIYVYWICTIWNIYTLNDFPEDTDVHINECESFNISY